MNIFTENFLNVPTSVIAKSVREDGYYKFEQALMIKLCFSYLSFR